MSEKTNPDSADPVCIPPVVGQAMSRMVAISLAISNIVNVTNKLTSWDAKNEDWERAALRKLILRGFSELITFSSLFGFFLSFVVHEKMKEIKQKHMAEAFRVVTEHYEGQVEGARCSNIALGDESNNNKSNNNKSNNNNNNNNKSKRKREVISTEAGARVMEKYLVHGAQSGLIRHVPFSQKIIGYWDVQYKKNNLRTTIRQNFLYKLNLLICDVAGFARSRDWIGTYTPKRICMSLIAKSGELSANLEWRKELELDPISSLPRNVKVDIARKTADVAIYLLHLARELEMTAQDFNAVS